MVKIVTVFKESLILEYFEQLKVKLQNAITSVNKTQFTFIDTRINAEIAKMLVRGSFGVFTGVMNKSQLRPEVAENDQVKLLSKIRELLDAFEGGKKAGLISDQKKPGQPTSGQVSSEKGLEGIEGAENQSEVEDGPELRKRNILRQMEEDKMSIRASYEARITAELDEICSMFDEKTRQEIDELKSELILNIQRHPEDKEELFAKFKKQSRDIETTNQKAKEAAINRAMDKYRVELKADIEKLKKNAKHDLEAGNISQEDVDSYFGDDELDEYLKKLLEEQQRRYLASKGYMSDDSAIDQDEWERIFREQVGLLCTSGPFSGVTSAFTSGHVLLYCNFISGCNSLPKNESQHG